MSSPSRISQLALWREIVSKRHELNKPVNRHLDFIQSCFEELDSAGFVWSKDSILGIFLQLGLPEHGTFSSVNDILESRALLGLGTPAHQIKEVIQIEEVRHKAPRAGLMDLPLEIFNNILDILDRMAELENREIVPRKRQRMVVISESGNKQPYKTYLHRNSPILNSIQTFAVTSREIYQLCRPWLWQKLEFPTRLPAPIDLWTEDILLKQGSLVRSLDLDLSTNCSRSDGRMDLDPFYDNLATVMNSAIQERVSPNTAKKLITQCPNLSKLNISYTLPGDAENAVGVSAFLLDLLPLITSLKHLRQLRFTNFMGEGSAVKLPSELIIGLPLLESLKFTGLAVSTDQGTLDEDSFGYNLSQLRYLSTLELCDIDGTSKNWCLYNWPKAITHLAIENCGDVSPSSAHEIVHHIAPNVKDLTLGFDQGDGSWAIDPTWNSGLSFSLPSLTNLTLCTRNPHLLGSFQGCKSLKNLGWFYIRLEHCKALSRILFKSTWPQLKELVVYDGFVDEEDRDTRDQAIEDELVSMERYCERANIKANIRRRWH